MEHDLVAGYSAALGEGTTVDIGLTWYMYPSGADKADFAEPYVKLSHQFGPVKGLVGVAYAPKQEELGRTYNRAASYLAGTPDNPGETEDNFSVWGERRAPEIGSSSWRERVWP